MKSLKSSKEELTKLYEEPWTDVLAFLILSAVIGISGGLIIYYSFFL